MVTKKYDIQIRLVKFSADIIKKLKLNECYAQEHLLRQIIRSSTSAALNYGEAQSAESKRDFIHKMKICLKELRESQINLQISKEAELVKQPIEFEKILNECNELVAIFTSSISTTSKNN